MSETDRRKFLRVLFEASFEVRAAEWSDKEATGLDISLNGCRFNCKQSISDSETVKILFKPGLELDGIVRWCWPIEWYFQAALHFEDITKDDLLRAKDLGLCVAVWTVNEPDDIDAMIDLHVDAIITDYPGRVQRRLSDRGWLWAR